MRSDNAREKAIAGEVSSQSLSEILDAEMRARQYLNDRMARRKELDEECGGALRVLNSLKRQAYRLGFTGNIMRDAYGNRVNTLSTPNQEKDNA